VLLPDGEGGFWLAASSTVAFSNEASLWRGHPDTGFERASMNGVRGWPMQLQLRPGAPDELWLRTSVSNNIFRLYRFDVSALNGELVTTSAADFEVLEDGTVVFVNSNRRGISRIEDGSTVPETIPDSEDYIPAPGDTSGMEREMLSIGESRIAGVFAGNDEGQLHQRVGPGVWEVVAENLLSSSIRSIAEFEDGILAGFYNGQLIQYSATSDWCETVGGEAIHGSVGTNFSIEYILRMRRGVLVSGIERVDADVTDAIGAFVSFFEVPE
jgi:hypothetical protein